MAFEIGFRGSTNTGNGQAFTAGIARAVERRQARHDAATETVFLQTGETLQLVLDPEVGMALIIAETMSEELSLFAYALADETATFLQAMNLTAATPNGGDPPALLIHFPEVWRMEAEDWLFEPLQEAFEEDAAVDDAATERQAAIDKALAERRAQLATNRERTPRGPSTDFSVKPRPSLFQRLSDALLGKAI